MKTSSSASHIDENKTILIRKKVKICGCQGEKTTTLVNKTKR